MKVILKTDIGIERIVLSRLKDLDIPCSLPPDGLRGILLVDKAGPETAKQLDSIPEITTILPIDAECPSNLEAIVKAGTSAAQTRLQNYESFAVRTVRRGKQAYSSMDVSISLGAAIVEALGCPVNLDTPDQVVHVDIVEDRTYISIIEGTSQHKKNRAGTAGTLVANKTAIIQSAYLYRSDATASMGHRIGRSAQAFGIRELVLAIQEKTEARDLMRLIEGVYKGRQTRYSKMETITSGKATKIPVHVADLYQTVRERADEPIIISSALGDPLSAHADKIKTLYQEKRVNVFIGAREGVPKGLNRFADLVVNLCPGLTYATEHGIPAAMVGLVSCFHEGVE
jgi:tRNA acetyltransferase TAN1